VMTDVTEMTIGGTTRMTIECVGCLPV
jgi:hypothetical protein